MTLDTTRAQLELGYHPIVSIDEGIIRTAHWLKDHGRLQTAIVIDPRCHIFRLAHRQSPLFQHPARPDSLRV